MGGLLILLEEAIKSYQRKKGYDITGQAGNSIRKDFGLKLLTQKSLQYDLKIKCYSGSQLIFEKYYFKEQVRYQRIQDGIKIEYMGKNVTVSGNCMISEY
jgi:hypothetical protein